MLSATSGPVAESLMCRVWERSACVGSRATLQGAGGREPPIGFLSRLPAKPILGGNGQAEADERRDA